MPFIFSLLYLIDQNQQRITERRIQSCIYLFALFSFNQSALSRRTSILYLLFGLASKFVFMVCLLNVKHRQMSSLLMHVHFLKHTWARIVIHLVSYDHDTAFCFTTSTAPISAPTASAALLHPCDPRMRPVEVVNIVVKSAVNRALRVGEGFTRCV